MWSSDIDRSLQNNSKYYNINTIIIDHPDRQNMKVDRHLKEGDGRTRTHAGLAPPFQPLRPSKLSQISTTLFSNLLA